MTKIILLQNTVIKHERHVAGEVVELEEDVAKHFVEARLGYQPEEPEAQEEPEIEDEAEEITTEASETAENIPEEAAEEITTEDENKEAETANKGNKKGKK